MIEGSKILIIEDDPGLQISLRRVLSGSNEVIVAGSIRESRKCANSFNVVLLDKSLPDGNGIHLIPTLRKTNPLAAVIVLTGDTDYSPVREALAAGADDYLVKSEQLIADLWVRIPIAMRNAERRAVFEDRALLPACRLPRALSEVTPEHFDRYRDVAERDYLVRAIELSKHSFEDAAARMGMGRSTLFAKLRQMGVTRRSAEA